MSRDKKSQSHRTSQSNMMASTALQTQLKIDQNNIDGTAIDPNQTINESWFKQDFQSPQDNQKFMAISQGIQDRFCLTKRQIYGSPYSTARQIKKQMNQTVTDHFSGQHLKEGDSTSSQLKGLKGHTNNQNVFSQNQQRAHKKLPVVIDSESIEQIERKIDTVVKSHPNVDRFSPIRKLHDDGS